MSPSPKPGASRTFEHRQRVTSGLVYAALMILAAGLGAFAFGLAMLVVYGLCARELTGMMRPQPWYRELALLSICAVPFLSALMTYVAGASDLVILCLLGAALFDTASYYGGKLMRGPKLWPALSPNKTWSGVLIGWGGMVLASSIAMNFPSLVSLRWPPVFSIETSSQAGDLVAAVTLLSGLFLAGDLGVSALKRRHGRKDTGQFMPGHGGMLDRVDSLLLAFPLMCGGDWLLRA